jgi:type IV secretory pathway VirB10-like protein
MGNVETMDKKIIIQLNPKALISFLVIILFHMILFFLNYEQAPPKKEFNDNKTVLNILPSDQPKIKTLGKTKGSKKNDIFISPKVKTPDTPKPENIFKAAAAQNPWKKAAKKVQVTKQDEVHKTDKRPGTKPTTPSSALSKVHPPSKKLIETIQETATNYQGAVASSPTLSQSNVDVQVEVPEGVNLNELNEFELMFYSFQKRMMEKYIESIILQVRAFERHHPRKSLFPEGKHVMTSRVTFDKDGNIMQIKMIRWTQVPELQNIFEEAIKSMNSLPNPPKMLWEKSGEFTVFYNFVVNNI